MVDHLLLRDRYSYRAGRRPASCAQRIFSRAVVKIGTGIALGIIVAAITMRFAGGEMRGFNALPVLPVVALFMLAVGVIAVLGPARRGRAIQPNAVLKDD